MRPKKINTIILGNLSSKVNRLTKKEQDPAEPCRFRQDLGIVIGGSLVATVSPSREAPEALRRQ